jgi:hypothetical protein
MLCESVFALVHWQGLSRHIPGRRFEEYYSKWGTDAKNKMKTIKKTVPNVQSLRSVQNAADRSRSRFKRSIVQRQTGTSMFREFSKCRMAARVNFLRSVKLVRDLGNLGKSGSRERLIIERAITPSALCPLPVRNEFRPGISWQQRSG